jgi:uncharacterized protein
VETRTGSILAVSLPPSFDLPRWLANRHLQTLGASLPLWAPRRLASDAARIPLTGDGALHGLVGWQPDTTPHAAVVLVHGVGGTANSRYVARAALALHHAGHHVLRLNLRGAGAGVHTAPSLYHAGLTADLAAAVAWLGASPRVNGVFVLGFSLGGHVALRWAGELGGKLPPLLRGVAAVSAPFDLERTTQHIERLRSLPYHRYVVGNLVAQARRFADLHPRRVHYSPADLRRVRTVRAYDTLVVAPMHGWKSAEDYYAAASAGPYVHAIELPSLVVHAEDDPMVPAQLVRDALVSAPPAVEQRWSERGGHVGWFAGLGERAWLRTWAIERVLEFFERHAAVHAGR